MNKEITIVLVETKETGFFSQVSGLAKELSELHGDETKFVVVQSPDAKDKPLDFYRGKLNNYTSPIAITRNLDSIDFPIDIVISGYGKVEESISYVEYLKNKNPYVYASGIWVPERAEHTFDANVLPVHKPSDAENAILIPGAMHGLTEEAVDEAIANPQFQKFAKSLEKEKTISALIGGSSNNEEVYKMTPEFMVGFLEQLKESQISQDANLIINTSRRTPKDCVKLIEEFAYNNPNVHVFSPESDMNPYKALLKFSDFIVATNDSISMPSEALSFGKPVFIVCDRKDTMPVFDEQHKRGLVKFFGVDDFTENKYKHLILTKEVATVVYDRFLEHREKIKLPIHSL